MQSGWVRSQVLRGDDTASDQCHAEENVARCATIVNNMRLFMDHVRRCPPDSLPGTLPRPGGAKAEDGATPRVRSSWNEAVVVGLRQTSTVTARVAVYRAVEAVEQSIAGPGLPE